MILVIFRWNMHESPIHRKAQLATFFFESNSVKIANFRDDWGMIEQIRKMRNARSNVYSIQNYFAFSMAHARFLETHLGKSTMPIQLKTKIRQDFSGQNSKHQHHGFSQHRRRTLLCIFLCDTRLENEKKDAMLTKTILGSRVRYTRISNHRKYARYNRERM